jgi:hypothetical protein
MKSNTIECTFCGRELTEFDSIAITTDDTPSCERCENDCWRDTNMVVTFSPEGITTSDWCAEFGFREDTTHDGITDFEWFGAGHRGHYKAVLQDGYTEVCEGWVTGDYDDVHHKHLFNKFLRLMEKSQSYEALPCEFVIAFGSTSNVFSRTAIMVVKQEHFDRFVEFLYQNDFPVSSLQKALD